MKKHSNAKKIPRVIRCTIVPLSYNGLEARAIVIQFGRSASPGIKVILLKQFAKVMVD